MRRAPLLILLAVGFSSCTTAIRPENPDTFSQGGLILSFALKNYWAPDLLNHWAERVYLVPVRANGSRDLDHPVKSNFRGPKYNYFLNLPPGRYAPVYASYTEDRVFLAADLDQETSKRWELTLSSGQIVFAGDFEFQFDPLPDFWTGVANTFRRVYAYIPPFHHPVIKLSLLYPTFKRDASDEAAAQAFWQAQEDLKGTLWVTLIADSLKSIGNPSRPLRERGWFFHKPLVQIPYERFSYPDILEWKAPARIGGGLEWREPGGRAAVAVRFMEQGAADVEPADNYLKELKQTGSPEDPHTLSQVVFSSHTAYMARYTTYAYPQSSLVGSQTRVFITEAWVVPVEDGYYLMHYRAEKKDFGSYYDLFSDFIGHIVFLPKPKAAPPKKNLLLPGISSP